MTDTPEPQVKKGGPFVSDLEHAKKGGPEPQETRLVIAAQRFVDAYEADLLYGLNVGLAPIMNTEPPSAEEGERLADELSAAFNAIRIVLASSPREPQKDETPRDAMIQHIQRMGGVRVLLSETMQEVAAYRKKCACNGLNECAECQRLDDLQDRLITRYKKLLELEVPREPHAALIAAIQRLRNAAPTDSDRIRCEVWTDDIHLVLEALKGQQT